MHRDRQSIETLPTAASRANGSAQPTNGEANLDQSPGPLASSSRWPIAAVPSLFNADWVEEIDEGYPQLKAIAPDHPPARVARAVERSPVYRPHFPLGAPGPRLELKRTFVQPIQPWSRDVKSVIVPVGNKHPRPVVVKRSTLRQTLRNGVPHG